MVKLAVPDYAKLKLNEIETDKLAAATISSTRRVKEGGTTAWVDMENKVAPWITVRSPRPGAVMYCYEHGGESLREAIQSHQRDRRRNAG